MDTRFLLLKNVSINTEEIETVDVGEDGSMQIHFVSGNNRSFAGDDAEALRRFLAPVTAEAPEAPAAPKGKKTGPGYDDKAKA